MLIENELRDFRLGGAELAAEQKQRFRAIRERQSEISTRFAENVLDATNAFALYLTDPAELAGVPDDALQMLRESASAEGRSGYKITLQFPSYSVILDYASDRSLRERLYHAFVTRASDHGNPDWNNGPLMVELVRLRDEHARLLDYPHYADLSLVPKMAEIARATS